MIALFDLDRPHIVMLGDTARTRKTDPTTLLIIAALAWVALIATRSTK